MSPKIWTVLELLKTSTEYLQSKGIENPRLEAEILLSHALKVNRIDLYLNFDKPVNTQELEAFRGLLKRRVRREPLQYITGHKEFWSLDFKINKHVLIPRPETELLVEEAIAIARGFDNGKHPLLILDIGTGSGAVAISLAKELKSGLIYATDISKEAIMVAKENANIHEVERNITFLNGYLFEPVLDKAGFFDLVVSNPPYIPTADFMELAPEIRDFEPRDALNGGEDGLEVISHVVSEATVYLRNGGWLLFEVGEDQWKKVFSLIEVVDQFGPPSVIKDYSGIERVVKVQKIR